jgi:hypothetical protein
VRAGVDGTVIVARFLQEDELEDDLEDEGEEVKDGPWWRSASLDVWEEVCENEANT